MALRVLLADESSAIKKVLQVSLHDFAVEVRVVPIGLDVIEVANSFKPDIIFADVLLQKMNGYEVCSQIKHSPALKNTPVVLMWSSFMSFDEKKATEAGANDKIEKPFDTDTIRNIVKKFVPKTQSQVIGDFLEFPELPPQEQKPSSPTPKPPSAESSGKILLDVGTDSALILEEEESFESVPLGSMNPASAMKKADTDEWARQDLSRFRLAEQDIPLYEPDMQIQLPKEPLNPEDFLLNPEEENTEKTPVPKEFLEKSSANTKSPSQGAVAEVMNISDQQIEAIVAKQIKAAVESAIWKILPSIAERVIREEIQKLMQDTEKDLSR